MQTKDRVKLYCIALFIVLFVAFVLTNDNVARKASAFTGELPNGFTGAPGETTCATSGCHTGALNTGPGSFNIEVSDLGPGGVYEEGKTYTIVVKPSTPDESRRRWGFQLTILNEDNSSAGTLEELDNLTTILSNSGPNGDRQYIQHSRRGTFEDQPPDDVSWTFKWIAPSSGWVTFYLAGIHANGNGTSTGDQTYTSSDFFLVSTPTAPAAAPVVASARVEGKRLFVLGENFAEGADILVDGKKQKTSNDKDNPTMILIAKKAGKKIEPLVPVKIKVKNPDGMESNDFDYMRPADPENP